MYANSVFRCVLAVPVSILLLVVVLLSGCEKEIKMDLGDQGGTITMFAFVETGESLNLSLSQSVNILSSQSYDMVENGRCEIFKNSVKLKDAFFPEDTIWQRYPDLTFGDGDTLHINVYVDDILKAQASSVIPLVVDIDAVDTSRIIVMGDDGLNHEYVKTQVTFSDPVGDADYYQLVLESDVVKVVGEDTVGSLVMVDYEKEDNIFNSNDQGSSSIGNIDFQGIFNDSEINGQTYSITTMVPAAYFNASANELSKSFRVILYHITADYYQYFRSRMIAKTYESLPIFDPVKIYSNVDGGLGVVAGLSPSVHSFIVK